MPFTLSHTSFASGECIFYISHLYSGKNRCFQYSEVLTGPNTLAHTEMRHQMTKSLIHVKETAGDAQTRRLQ